MERVGPLLTAALARAEHAGTDSESMVAAAYLGTESPRETLPVVLKIPTVQPHAGEPWREYRERVLKALQPMEKRCATYALSELKPLIAANAIRADISPDGVRTLMREASLELMELDPVVQVVDMDDAVVDVGLPELRRRASDLTGMDVKVAVLDSGVDAAHPHLNVADSVSTHPEGPDVPGSHGTHCAGSIASRDVAFPGIAPDATLLNVKVLDAQGRGQYTYVTAGIDEALDRDADVISLSLGWNHLPTWSAHGHGWFCPNGRCPLCTAVDNAVTLDNVVVVVAAGNEHEFAENLRAAGSGNTFDTELGCPGQARQVLTVGAVTKRYFHPASFSSRGPTAYTLPKPDLCAPGVNITSTVPVPRQADGSPIPNPRRFQLFASKSGTSMATPIVAGACALIVQQLKAEGAVWSPADVRQRLLSAGLTGVVPHDMALGHGVLNLSRL